MPFKGKRYPGVEGKIVEYVEANYEEELTFVHIRFTDKTALSIAFAAEMSIDCVELYAVSNGNYEVLREYVRPKRLR